MHALMAVALVSLTALTVAATPSAASSRRARLVADEVGGQVAAAGHFVVYAPDARTVAAYDTRSRRTRRFAIPCTPVAVHGGIALVACAAGMQQRPAFQGLPYVLDIRSGVVGQVPVHDEGNVQFGGGFWDIGSVWIAGTGCSTGIGKCGPTYINWHTGEISPVYDDEFGVQRNLDDPKLNILGSAEKPQVASTGPFRIFELQGGLFARRGQRMRQVCSNPPRGCMAPRAAYGVLAWSATAQPMAYARNLRTGRVASWAFPEGVSRYPSVPVPVQPLDGRIVFAVQTGQVDDQATTELWIASTRSLETRR
jgi:hypothetical protein